MKKELNINRAMLRPAGPSVWGEIYGDIQDQEDLIKLIGEGGGLTPEEKEKIEKIDDIEAELETKADKSEIPSLEGYATEQELQGVYQELNNKIGDLTALTEEILGE